MRDVARREEVVAGAEVDPLAADEDGDLALDDVERLVLVVVDMQRSGGAARVEVLDLRECVTGLGTARLDGHPAGLPPEVGEAFAGGNAVRLAGDLGWT